MADETTDTPRPWWKVPTVEWRVPLAQRPGTCGLCGTQVQGHYVTGVRQAGTWDHYECVRRERDRLQVEAKLRPYGRASGTQKRLLEDVHAGRVVGVSHDEDLPRTERYSWWRYE